MTTKSFGTATNLAVCIVVVAIFMTPIFGAWVWLGVGFGLYAGKKCIARLRL